MERKIAIVSIGTALLHGLGETWWHFQFGQFLPMLIVDYIAVSLLLFAGIRSLQTGLASGLLCGVWGFEFCLNYRTLFWRVEVWLTGEATAEMEAVIYVLGTTFFFSLAMSFATLYLCTRRV